MKYEEGFQTKAKTKPQKILPHRDERPASAASKETTPTRSYSQVASRNPSVTRKELTAPKSKMQDMKELIEKMYKKNQKLYKLVLDGQKAFTKSQNKSCHQDEIIQNEHRAEARQVQQFTMYVRETANQMDRSLEVVNTLSKASSCGDDSTLSSMMESISEIYRKQRELKINLAADKSIPSEVIMNKAAKLAMWIKLVWNRQKLHQIKIKMKISLIAHQRIRKMLSGLQRILRRKMLMVFKLQAGNTGHQQHALKLCWQKKMSWKCIIAIQR